MKLREYQDRMIFETRQAFREGHRCVLQQLPTGGGKTVQASFMLGTAMSKGHTSFFVVHRRELIEQTVSTFEALNLPFGVIAAGVTPNYLSPIQICSIDTLKRRLGKVQKPRFIVWDECHHIGAQGWQNVFNSFPDTYHVGLSATPVRLDGRGLDSFFTKMVSGPSFQALPPHLRGRFRRERRTALRASRRAAREARRAGGRGHERDPALGPRLSRLFLGAQPACMAALGGVQRPERELQALQRAR